MPETPSRTRAQLGVELHAARTLSGLNQRDLAVKLEISQALVSRAERGQRLLDRNTVTAWLKAVKASPEVRSRVLALTEVAHTETRTWSDLLASDQHLQETSRVRNAGAVLVQNWQPTVVPGLLQTADYARQVIQLADTDNRVDHEAALAARINRQGVLRETGRRFDFVIAERLLRWEPAPGVLAPQLAHLIAAAQLDAVNLAVLPENYAGALPWHNFVIRQPADDEPAYVNVEYIHGEATITDPESVGVYQRMWDRLWKAAMIGDEAVDVIRRAA